MFYQKYESTVLSKFEGFLIAGNFKIEEVILAAGKVAYTARRSKNQDFSEEFNGQDISKLEISGELNFLNKLKKLRDKTAFFIGTMRRIKNHPDIDQHKLTNQPRLRVFVYDCRNR
ncbi:hypothetical protein ACFSKL_10280 [Belliella marina]|uniref:Uncharacterized protein n=1 Tax=Belliella marina TaxID=1644146 RepID=A0ABW4VNS6_9BACT